MELETWRLQFRQSIKAIDVEDRVDLYLYRPLGLVCAKIGGILGMSPTQITFAGLALGLISGMFFFWNQTNDNLIIASLLLIASGILDSADGQLARLTGTSSRFGLVLDGVSDNLVFSAVYIGCTLTLMPEYGPSIWLLAVPAGVCHSMQSATLDFYNREYLYFGCGFTKGDYWNPSLKEARDALESSELSWKDRLAWRLRYSWLWQQQLMSGRSIDWRHTLQRMALGNRADEFRKIYAKYQAKNMRLWHPLGANMHTAMIIVFAFLRRFDLYLLLVDVIALSCWLVIMRQIQKYSDKQMMEEMLSLGMVPPSL